MRQQVESRKNFDVFMVKNNPDNFLLLALFKNTLRDSII
jgi:hypothetical protein